MRGTQPLRVLHWNSGSFFDPGVMASKFFMAVTGQMGFEPRKGIFKILTIFLVWKVLDHLMSTCIPGCAKLLSPLAK